MKIPRKKRPKSLEYEYFLKQLNELTPWHRFLVMQLIRWMVFKNKIKDIPNRWVEFQLDLEEEIRDYGMPHKLRWQFRKWFNVRPFPETTKYFMWNGRKIWYEYALEKCELDFFLAYKDQFPGSISFNIKKDGTAEMLTFHIDKDFRNAGLGTFVFQESAKLLEGRVTHIKGVLQKKYDPKYEDSLRWLRKQGFEITQRKNGDYEFVFWMKNKAAYTS